MEKKERRKERESERKKRRDGKYGKQAISE